MTGGKNKIEDKKKEKGWRLPKRPGTPVSREGESEGPWCLGSNGSR